MQQTIDEVFDDQPTLIDANEYDNAYIKPGSLKFYDGTRDDGSPWRMISFYWTIDNPEQKEKTGLESPGAGQSFFLDLAADGKSLTSGPNRNVKLGAVRKALGQEGAPWNFAMLEGAGPARVKVIHSNDKNGNPRAEVVAVTKQ
jgi:hypothetical protein